MKKIMSVLFLFCSMAISGQVYASGNVFTSPFLDGVFIDAADGNRFFTRIGGTAIDQLEYRGLLANQTYVLESTLVAVGSNTVNAPVVTEFTATASAGTLEVEFPIAPNQTDVNIDYVADHTLYEVTNGTRKKVLVFEGDNKNPARTIQVHSIQRIKIVSVADARDGDLSLDGQGGEIIVKLRYENMVEGYKYTIWGQLLTPSGQAIGVFASIPTYAPVRKRGHVMLTFKVPAGYEGLSLIPSVGIYHHSRVTLAANGYLNWNEGAPNPIMIASDTSLTSKTKTVEIGVPFGQTAE